MHLWLLNDRHIFVGSTPGVWLAFIGDGKVGPVTTQWMKPVLFGLIVGLAAALALGRLLTSQLYQMSAHNPLSLLATATILTWLPSCSPLAWPACSIQ